MLALKSAAIGYGPKHRVLADVALHIAQGERVALLGKSGSGKSTLLAHLRTLANGHAAWCPQQASLVPQLSAFHNIYAGGLGRQWALTNLRNLLFPAEPWRSEIGELAQALGLSDCLWSPAGQLSGGQQSRVAMARAVYQQQPLLLADEPVAALDGHQGAALLPWLMAQHQTAVIALHHVDLALAHCTRVIGLAEGRIQIDAPAANLNARELAWLYQ
ncbi:ATP-binding cassette domain-containing protein [Simiduia sp. 21SJ11W-1]|uniref:ATP-binding cassette domain-containing protein n=1 Tax=Simiduia sp. 21SJ11W-1 TaxID=2909669 RepID=UPI00209EA1E9|nr:ATP-binding cassette domain-containing protein [Simiduia sp. 21SJ11W-1]UTA48196.1 ATP-binding cassette domain-containing protein [Simiduia sp. 21SJ11W-1]